MCFPSSDWRAREQRLVIEEVAIVGWFPFISTRCSLFRYSLYENIISFSGCSPFSVHFNVSLVFQPSFCSEKFISTISFYYNDYFEDISPLSALCLYTHDVVDDDEGTARERARKDTQNIA